MIIATTQTLPVGHHWRPANTRRRRWIIEDAIRGRYSGPLFVVRAATLDEYAAWCLENTGQTFTRRQRANLKHQSQFYEIAID